MSGDEKQTSRQASAVHVCVPASAHAHHSPVTHLDPIMDPTMRNTTTVAMKGVYSLTRATAFGRNWFSAVPASTGASTSCSTDRNMAAGSTGTSVLWGKVGATRGVSGWFAPREGLGRTGLAQPLGLGRNGSAVTCYPCRYGSRPVVCLSDESAGPG